MTDDPVKQALAELQDVVRCRCHPAYTGRGLHDPDCNCDSAEALKVVSDRIEAQAAEIERLRGDVEKRRETRMSDDDLIRRGDALYAIAGWEIPSTAISALPALPAVTQPAPDTAADRIKALTKERDTAREYAGEVRIREKVAEDARIKAEAKLAKAVDEALEILNEEGWLGKSRERIELLKTGAKP